MYLAVIKFVSFKFCEDKRRFLQIKLAKFSLKTRGTQFSYKLSLLINCHKVNAANKLDELLGTSLQSNKDSGNDLINL